MKHKGVSVLDIQHLEKQYSKMDHFIKHEVVYSVSCGTL